MGLGEYLSSLLRAATSTGRPGRGNARDPGDPEYETAEAAEILAAHGLQASDARQWREIMRRNPEFMADFMMQYEIGMADPSGEAPALRGIMTFAAFVSFGLAPLVPYFRREPVPVTFAVSVVAAFAALVVLGPGALAGDDADPARSVGETVLVGGICAAVAYAVGGAFRLVRLAEMTQLPRPVQAVKRRQMKGG